MTNRVSPISARLLSSCQSAFVKGSYILESVVTAHETIHELYQSKKPGVILKLDYEKAYDRVNWDFLVEMLSSRGFGNKWITCVVSTIQHCSFRVTGRSHVSHSFQTSS